ncbi:MAG: hypothetical protein ACJ762_03500 [Solirubrobacteraceae bacterium]
MPFTAPRMLCATAVALVVLTAPAQAAEPTVSNIVTPTAAQAGDIFDFVNGVTSSDIAVTGTSNGTSGQVRVSCWYRDPAGVPQKQSGGLMNVAANGTFSGTVQAENLTGCPGTLRAVPSALAITMQDQLTPFTGPPARYALAKDYKVSGSATPANNGRSYDFFASTQGSQGYFDVLSAGSCGINEANVVTGDQVGLTDFYCNGGFFTNNQFASTYRSGILVDGHNAYVADSAKAITEDYPGLPFLTWSREYDAPSGNLTLHETSGIVRCPSDTTNAQTTPGNCPSFVDTGVTLTRTSVISHDGRMLRQTDVFASTTGAHALDLVDYESWRAYTGTQTWLFPGETTPAKHTVALEVLPIAAQSAPSSIAIQHDPSQPGDSLSNPRSAVTMWPAGDSFRVWGTDSSSGYLNYSQTVPASGNLVLERVYTHDWRAAQAAALQTEAEDLLVKPTLSLTGPADGSTVATPAATVTGSASDNKSVTVKVNGVATPLTSGSFSAGITLAEGPNTITVVASDGAGNATTATRTVTYTKPVVVPPAVLVPSVGKSGLVSCPAGGADCTAGAIWTSAKAFTSAAKKRKVVMARWSATIPAGKTAVARAVVTKAGRRLLRKRSVRTVRRISARAGTGPAKAASRTVTLKRLKKKG